MSWPAQVSDAESSLFAGIPSRVPQNAGDNDNLSLKSRRRRRKGSFICSWTNCGRLFGKLEHLQRHERSHAGDVRYECPICKKRFVRSDVMTRHTSIHNAASLLIKKQPRKVSCNSCATLKVRCDGQAGISCTRCIASAQACVYRNTDKTGPLGVESSQTSTDLPPDPPGPSNIHELVQDAARRTASDVPPSPSHIDHANSVNPVYQTVESNSMVPASLQDSDLPLESLYGFVVDSSETYFGWEIGDTVNHLRTLNSDAPSTPPGYGFSSDMTHSMAFSTPTAAYEREGALPNTLPSPTATRDSQPADTPWPHVYKPSAEDTRINLTPISQRSRSALFEEDLDRVGESTREAMLSLVGISHQPHWPTIDVASFPSTQTLSVCINLYFRHFHESLPVLRRSTFRISEVPPVLLLAMAAIGATYSRDGLGGLAIAMNELARRAISHMRENDLHAMFDTSIVQAWLLQSMFGLFCGSRMLYQHAEISRGGLVTAARRMHLLRPSLTFVEELKRRKETASPEELRKAYSDDEERRRLGWGIYLYDMQISCLLGISPHFSTGEVNMPLPADEEIWNTPISTLHFESELQSKSPGFRDVSNSLLSNGRLPQSLNPFGYSIMAYTLYRYCTDACEYRSILSQPWASTDSPYRLAFPSNFKQNPQTLLDQLSDSCSFTSCTPNSLIVSVSALSHLCHIQFTWPGFLESIKIAAGKSGTETSKEDARSWLSAIIAEDQVSARSILVHAGQLSSLLLRYTFDAPHETVWMFDAALTFWAMAKFGTGLYSSSDSPNKITITWSESDEVYGWIQNGGRVSFQGIGDLSELTASRVLSVFVEKLENMPWGIAQRFRHVLMSLRTEETL